MPLQMVAGQLPSWADEQSHHWQPSTKDSMRGSNSLRQGCSKVQQGLLLPMQPAVAPHHYYAVLHNAVLQVAAALFAHMSEQFCHAAPWLGTGCQCVPGLLVVNRYGDLAYGLQSTCLSHLADAELISAPSKGCFRNFDVQYTVGPEGH